MATLVTGTPGCGKTTLVQYADQNNDPTYFDADEIKGLCEWRDFKTNTSMGLIDEFIETGKDDWYEQYGWYWRPSALKKFVEANPDAILCGSSENIVENYALFDRIIIIRATENELIKNLQSPERNNPFGKTPKQRAGFMKWQDYLISEAQKYQLDLIDGNNTTAAYAQINALIKQS